MSLISPGRSVVSVAIRLGGKAGRREGPGELVKNITRRVYAASASLFNCMQSIGPAGRHRATHVPRMAASIRDLKVWQEAVALAAEIVRSARQGARRETKVVTDQLML